LATPNRHNYQAENSVAELALSCYRKEKCNSTMPLIPCPECGREVSTEAKACPACGFPVAEKVASPALVQADELLAEVRPSWWRYFWWLCFSWLIVPFFVAWIKRRATLLRVYRERVTLKRGIFSKCERELFMRDIRSVDIDQSFLGRLANVGDLTIATAASADAVEFVEGVPDPKRIRDLIVAQRQSQ
jgi:membrane protein YdbS with pleckstrin-like domain